jgi:hypothetical protein
MPGPPYATVSWTATDLADHIANKGLKDITVQEADEWFSRNARHIQEAMVREGWNAIDTLTIQDPPGDNK